MIKERKKQKKTLCLDNVEVELRGQIKKVGKERKNRVENIHKKQKKRKNYKV